MFGPEPPDRFLGCYVKMTKEPVSQIRESLHQHLQCIRKDENSIVSRAPFKGSLDTAVNII